MSNNNEKVYCERCPIINVCFGKGVDPEPTYEKDCVLAKLYYGELKIDEHMVVHRQEGD